MKVEEAFLYKKVKRIKRPIINAVKMQLKSVPKKHKNKTNNLKKKL